MQVVEQGGRVMVVMLSHSPLLCPMRRVLYRRVVLETGEMPPTPFTKGGLAGCGFLTASGACLMQARELDRIAVE